MTITQPVTIPADHRLMIDVPPEVPAGPGIIVFLPVTLDSAAFKCDAYDYSEELFKIRNRIKNPPYSVAKSQGGRMFGRAKGLFQMADDFDAPLEDLKDYM